MNEKMKCLIELQEVDSAIIALAERIEELPKKLDQYKAPLKNANEQYQAAKAKSEALFKKKKDKDGKLDEIQDKIDKLKSRSGDIKTNKEYEAHLKEIQSFEKSISNVEDEILSVMEEIEAFGVDLNVEEAKIKSAEAEFEQHEKLVGEEVQKLKEDLEKDKSRRSEFVSRLGKEEYEQYMILLKRLGDKAVVETRDEICMGCNTNIPPQLYNDIKKNDKIYKCFYCSRFLYYKAPPPMDSQSEESA